jgi:predicted solute-binding protein
LLSPADDRRISDPSAFPRRIRLHGRSFDKIFDAVESGRADAGLIIRGQLTYARSGLKIVDLGEWWKLKTGLPLPLGGNVVRKDIPPPVRRDVSEIIREASTMVSSIGRAVAYSLHTRVTRTRSWPASL